MVHHTHGTENLRAEHLGELVESVPAVSARGDKDHDVVKIHQLREFLE